MAIVLYEDRCSNCGYNSLARERKRVFNKKCPKCGETCTQVKLEGKNIIKTTNWRGRQT